MRIRQSLWQRIARGLSTGGDEPDLIVVIACRRNAAGQWEAPTLEARRLTATHDEPMVPFEVGQMICQALGAAETRTRLQGVGLDVLETVAHYARRKVRER